MDTNKLLLVDFCWSSQKPVHGNKETANTWFWGSLDRLAEFADVLAQPS